MQANKVREENSGCCHCFVTYVRMGWLGVAKVSCILRHRGF